MRETTTLNRNGFF